MLRTISFPSITWHQKAIDALISSISFLVFAFLDLVDLLLCFFYRFIDSFLEENPIPCYCCYKNGDAVEEEEEGEEEEISETLYNRKNIFRDMIPSRLRRRKDEDNKKKGVLRLRSPRWSDCGCESCVWPEKKEEEEKKLHLVARLPSQGLNHRKQSIETAIFMHGFLSSSSLWIERVFPNLSQTERFNLIAMDLLGFGQSPKPANCLYTLKDHVDMVDKSVMESFQLESFHLVAHSMGCVVALAFAAKHPTRIKSISLAAPPYFCSTEGKASMIALDKIAERKVWPLLLFGSSVMSWYEHLGRTICFLFCRNHKTWEWILRLFLRKRDVQLLFEDLTRHTHHSAWHSMHNVVCGGAKLLDKHLETLKKEGIPIKIIQGDKDQVVPLECSFKLKGKLPLSQLQIIPNTNHSSVILGREKAFAKGLEDFWFSSIECNNNMH